jgi:uncharacterized protein with von Willebrand factor type A (vWA) domain
VSALFGNLVRFGRILHDAGVDVPAGRMIDVASALDHIDIARRTDFYYGLRALLVHRHQDLAIFDELFRAFWRERRQRSPNDLRAMGRQRSLGKPEVVLTGTAPEAATGDQPADDTLQSGQIAATSYSAQDVLRAKDFAEFSDDELSEARRLMSQMRWDLGRRRTWRRRRNEGREPDLRRVARENIRYGGEPLRVPTRGRTWKPRPLVIIADVSGSMERYARMLLHFIFSLTGGDTGRPFPPSRKAPADRRSLGGGGQGRGRIEAFVFATRFTRITGEIARHGVRDAPIVARHVPDWGGGTRIGEAVRAFNVQWARRVVSRGAIVLLISDGWDRGDPALLGREMARLQRSCRRLIWLNPLLGAADYQPLTRGMQAALRYIDDFLPAHNLNSLEALAEHLERVSDR